MTFEIKGLIDYRLDRVDCGEGTSRGTTRLADTAANSSSSVHVYQWDGGFMVPRLPAF